VIRAFIAIDIDPQVRENISHAIGQLRSQVLGVRWIAPANFHLTLKFLGDIEQAQIETIGAVLKERLRPFPRFTINAKGLGVFPDLRRPRIMWIGLAGNELATLAAQVESALLPLGFAPEKRNFTPHLTVGRWRQTDRPSKTLGQELESLKDYQFGASNVDEVILFQSVLKPEGAIYTRAKAVTLRSDHLDNGPAM
jgi:2'-5' RNA ligase